MAQLHYTVLFIHYYTMCQLIHKFDLRIDLENEIHSLIGDGMKTKITSNQNKVNLTE